MNKGLIGFGFVAVALVVGVFVMCPRSSKDLKDIAVIPTVYAQTDNFVYEDFSQAKFDSLLGKEDFSVFVHNRSCGTCAKKNNEIIDEAAQFRAGTILKMEFSEAPKEFLNSYGVVSYDTFVNFSSNGSFETVRGGLVDDVRLAIQ